MDEKNVRGWNLGRANGVRRVSLPLLPLNSADPFSSTSVSDGRFRGCHFGRYEPP